LVDRLFRNVISYLFCKTNTFANENNRFTFFLGINHVVIYYLPNSHHIQSKHKIKKAKPTNKKVVVLPKR